MNDITNKEESHFQSSLQVQPPRLSHLPQQVIEQPTSTLNYSSGQLLSVTTVNSEYITRDYFPYNNVDRGMFNTTNFLNTQQEQPTISSNTTTGLYQNDYTRILSSMYPPFPLFKTNTTIHPSNYLQNEDPPYNAYKSFRSQFDGYRENNGTSSISNPYHNSNEYFYRGDTAVTNSNDALYTSNSKYSDKFSYYKTFVLSR